MSQQTSIYLDHAATTPLLPEVLSAMHPYFLEHFGNASSIHSHGRRALVALERARRTIAALIGAEPAEIIFTSGGSESDNMALRGIALARRAQTGANRIVVSAIEHHAVLHTAEALRDQYGFALTVLPVDREGRILQDAWQEVIGDGQDVAVVSVMLANNEIGTIQPVAEIASFCRKRGLPVHSDAVQAAGKMALEVNQLQVDAMSISAHKFYGPKGVGFLYLRRGTPFQPQQSGGSHESGRRAGTENVPGIVGMATAFEIAQRNCEAESQRLRLLRDHLIGEILERVDRARLTGATGDERLAHIASFVIPGIEAEALLIGLDMAGIAASSGSACVTASMKPSHVLAAIGVPKADRAGGLRFSLGRSNTAEQMDQVVETVVKVVARVRE